MTPRFKAYAGAFVLSGMCWALLITVTAGVIRSIEGVTDPVTTASVEKDEPTSSSGLEN